MWIRADPGSDPVHARSTHGPACRRRRVEKQSGKVRGASCVSLREKTRKRRHGGSGPDQHGPGWMSGSGLGCGPVRCADSPQHRRSQQTDYRDPDPEQTRTTARPGGEWLGQAPPTVSITAASRARHDVRRFRRAPSK